MNFENYLKNKKLSPASIKRYLKQSQYFINWMENENLGLKELVYNDILSYIGHLKPKGFSHSYRSSFLRAPKYYLDYKVLTGEIKNNPAQNLYLKSKTLRKVPDKLLTRKELDNLYQNYQSKRNANKVVLGLLVYQGLTVHDLQQLKPENIHLAEGKIYIPGTRKSNSRWLRLKAFQIISLQEYIKQTRPEIIKKTGTKSDKLIIGEKGSNELKARLMDLFAELRKLNPKAENAAQVRSSVLVEKLKTTGLRETQYFAGHKYVSSTERYKLGDIENLKKQIEKHHPLRGL
jgi:integrase/recombinase XerD